MSEAPALFALVNHRLGEILRSLYQIVVLLGVVVVVGVSTGWPM